MRTIRHAIRIAAVLLPAAACAETGSGGEAIIFKSLLSKIGVSRPVSRQPSETLGELREAVIARLRTEAQVKNISPDPDNPAVLRVELGGSAGKTINVTVDVTNVHGRLYTLRNDADRQAAIENLVQGIVAVVRKPEIDFNRIYANIRFRDKNLMPSGPSSPADALVEELAGDIAVVYQLDTPHSLSGVSHADIGDRSLDEIRQIARKNILREMSKLSEERANEHILTYQISDNTALSPAIVLTDEFWARVDRAFPAGALLILRQRDEVAVIDRRAPLALQLARRLIDMAKQRGIDFLSDHVFERRDGRLVVVAE
ncbi:hypothetical protein [Rhizobium terrae]|uniref:hypothetical protein n=1 Tax=Rhizobium terrae TaxID=2171756 RepID=UPI001D00D9DA|nr:hypothetical protein [Rhizobium terrae]